MVTSGENNLEITKPTNVQGKSMDFIASDVDGRFHDRLT